MFRVGIPEVIHDITYRSSGSSEPREVWVQISVVRYGYDGRELPTFVATADLQGREAAEGNRLAGELVADEIVALQDLDVLPKLDYCFLCGDFFDYPDLRKLGGTGDVTPAMNALSRTARETFAVLGNHDLISEQDLLESVRVLDGSTVKTDTLTISGVSGIIGDPKRNNRKSEADFLEKVDHGSTARTDVLLLHQGPNGPDEHHRGVDAINERLRRRSNLLVLFGHCHWPSPFHTEGRNQFANIDARVIVFVPEE